MDVHEPENEKSIDSEADLKRPLAQRIAVILLHWGVEIHGYGCADFSVLIQTYCGVESHQLR